MFTFFAHHCYTSCFLGSLFINVQIFILADESPDPPFPRCANCFYIKLGNLCSVAAAVSAAAGGWNLLLHDPALLHALSFQGGRNVRKSQHRSLPSEGKSK